MLKVQQRYDDMFEGTLGDFNGSAYKRELQNKVKQYHAKIFLILKVHEGTLRKKMETG